MFAVLLATALLCSASAGAQEAPRADTDASAKASGDDSPADADGVRSGYDGGFWVETADGNQRVKLSGGFTPRLNITDVDEPSDDGDEYQFLVRRARVKVSGHAFTPRLDWELQLGLGGSVRLLSGNIDYEILEDSLYLYAGMDRLPYMREQLTSHWRLQFAERSIVEDQFGEGYDTGIALHNSKRSGFEWSAGIYNGTRSDLDTNPPADIAERMFEPTLAARIGWSSDDMKGYTEGDVEGGPLRFGVGLTALSQLALPEQAERADKIGLDFILKAHGFSFVAAGHTAARSAGEGFFNQEIFVSGVRAQAGYVFASRFEPVVRYAVVIPRAEDTMTQEARGGLNVYLVGHRLKLQADAGAVTRTTPGVDATDWNGRLQAVVRF
ncbi:MAG: porin [Myxococcota bacterium]